MPTVLGQTGELEKLAEPDRVLSDRDVTRWLRHAFHDLASWVQLVEYGLYGVEAGVGVVGRVEGGGGLTRFRDGSGVAAGHGRVLRVFDGGQIARGFVGPADAVGAPEVSGA